MRTRTFDSYLLFNFSLWALMFGVALCIPFFHDNLDKGFTTGINHLPLLLTIHAMAIGLSVWVAFKTLGYTVGLNLKTRILGFSPILTELLLLTGLIVKLVFL